MTAPGTSIVVQALTKRFGALTAVDGVSFEVATGEIFGLPPEDAHGRTLEEARRDLATWLDKWQKKYPKLCDWVEENIEEKLTYYRLPIKHNKHLKSTNMLERLMEELKRRTHVVRIFPNAASCLRLVRAVAAEISRRRVTVSASRSTVPP